MLPLLKKNIESSTGQFALECLWATYQLGGLDDAFAQKCLAHKEPLVREWTVRLSGDMPLDLAAAANATGRAVPGPREVQDAHLMGHRFAETRASIPLARKLVEAANGRLEVLTHALATAERGSEMRPPVLEHVERLRAAVTLLGDRNS